MAVELLVQFQQRAARLAAEGCNAGTDTEEKEHVKEMVAEVVEWILSGTAAKDAPFAEVRHDGNVQTGELVSSQCMVRQDDGTEAGSESTEWPDAAEESHAALPEVMTRVAWEFLNKLRIESGSNAGCRAQKAVQYSSAWQKRSRNCEAPVDGAM